MFLLRSLVFSAALSAPLFSSALPAQAPVSAAAKQLQQRLLAPPAAVTLNIAQLRLSKFPRPELKIVGGVPRPGLLNINLDTDEIAHQNDTLTVRKVEASLEKKYDFLRITVATVNGATAKLAFQLGKGDLETMQEPALEHALASVLTPQGAAASADAGSQPQPQPPPSQPRSMDSPPPAGAKASQQRSPLDLPPAGPGYPAMHALQPPADGCRYETYSSVSLGVEVAYLQCPADSSMGAHVTVSEKGSEITEGQPGDMFTVYTKKPDEPLAEAVQRLIVAKFKDPAARLGCKVSSTENTVNKGPAVIISAVGAYSKRKTYPGNGQPCEGYAQNTEDQSFFAAFPDEDPARFIYLSNGKGTAQFPAETIHFRPASAAAASPSPAPNRVTPAKTTAARKIPPMKNVWTAQGRVPGVDLADEASTVVSFTHGMAFDSSAGDAIMAVTCEKRAGGSPALVLHTEVPLYPNQQLVLSNKLGTVMVGATGAKHQEQLSTRPGAHYLDVAAPLNQYDVQEMSANELIGNRTISLMYFGGASKDIASGDLPPADSALDAVLNACGVTTPARTVAQPSRSLSPDEVMHLQLAKLTLGSSVAEAKQALGPGIRFLPSSVSPNPAVAYLLATDNENHYTLTFISGHLEAYGYTKTFSNGAQPLILNMIHSVTEKTWMPLSGSSVGSTVWSADASGVPVDLAEERLHPNCRLISADGGQAPAPYVVNIVRLLDTGADCGVTISLSLSPADDKAMARSMTLLVADYPAIHNLVGGVTDQQKQQKDAQRKRAGQVATPF